MGSKTNELARRKEIYERLESCKSDCSLTNELLKEPLFIELVADIDHAVSTGTVDLMLLKEVVENNLPVKVVAGDKFEIRVADEIVWH